jgi:hypothetical protein
VQSGERGIAWNDNIRVVAEALQVTVPNVSMNIVVSSRGQSKKFNVPHRSQDESNDHNAPGETWCRKKLTNCEEIHDSRDRQSGHEVRAAAIAEVA